MIKEIPWLTEDSRTYLARGYLDKGQTPEQRVEVIANKAEEILGIKGFSKKVETIFERKHLSFSTPIWANFGTDRGCPISCFNSHISDSVESFLTKQAEVGYMTKIGGGTSGYFGEVRGRGESVSVGGKAEGAVRAMELFYHVTNIISQGSARRGHFAAYLPIDHPDLEEFLTIREPGHTIQEMSIGVCVSDEFMHRLLAKDKSAMKPWAKVLQKRTESGYPYIIFTGNANKYKPQVYIDKGLEIYSSNMCVTGNQRVVSSQGLVTAKELYERGGDLTLFDNENVVTASPMTLIEKNADVYRVTLENGLSHEITGYHKIVVSKKDENGIEHPENVECSNLKIGDRVAFQTKSGLFGTINKEQEAFELAESGSNAIPSWLWESDKITQSNYIGGLLRSKGDIVLSPIGGVYRIIIRSPDKDFLKNIQLILLNQGINSKIDEDKIILHCDEEYSKIVSIEYIGKEDVYCCKVNSDKHHWICNGFITHNCTEIFLPSTPKESFVCDLSSGNLQTFDEWEEYNTVEIMIYLLDAAMTDFINKTEHMPLMDAPRRFAINHRALGLGVLGWHDLLQMKRIPFESMEAKMLNVKIWKYIREKADAATKKLAIEYGEPPLLKGYGRRNTTTLAIAPTTSSSAILGQASPGIEPLNSNYFVNKLAKGNFTYKNRELEKLLIEKNINTPEIWNDILVHGGSVQHLPQLSQLEKDIFKTFGELSQKEIIIQAAQRQKYIDQGQSLNLTIPPDVDIKDLNKLMIFAWEQGIKSLYYQKSINPSQQLARNILTCTSCE
jgi:ribonucleotide reductase alpha subunit